MSVVSFLQLFSGPEAVKAVSVPMLQRDFAQGRTTGGVPRILAGFLAALHAALTGPRPLMLDFVYGDVSDRCLIPLDGQQRLTTLFLLHNYVAVRAGVPFPLRRDAFRYETRLSARTFCERLVENLPEWTGDSRAPKAWIEDQHWFARSWSDDPTIASMLVVLDGIHRVFGGEDAGALWASLVEGSAIQFHFLPLSEFELGDDLYVKMNSRGRRLTPFENFKGRFARILKSGDDHVAEPFEVRADNVWAAMLWPYAGEDNLVDDEMMAYLAFVTEVCGRLDGLRPVGDGPDDLEDAARLVFGGADAAAAARRRLLLQAFDCWCDPAGPRIGELPRPRHAMEQLFALNQHVPNKVTLWARASAATIDLFGACLKTYSLTPLGGGPSRRRVFSLKNTLLLYAVVLHRIEHTLDFPARLRILRNLIEHSEVDDVDKLGRQLEAVRSLVRSGLGALDALPAGVFDTRQLVEERRKSSLRDDHPELRAVLDELEDQPEVRGCLAAFDLDDVGRIAARAQAFVELTTSPDLWALACQALLATGDYSMRLRPAPGDYRFQLCVPTLRQTLDDLLTGARVDAMRGTLQSLLDTVGPNPGEAGLREIVAGFRTGSVVRRELDWRWYMLQYPVMQPESGWGHEGVYAGTGAQLGFSLRKLRTTYTWGYYRDAFLAAVVRADPDFAPATRGDLWDHMTDPWHSGDAAERWLTVKSSGARLCFLSDRICLAPPTEPAYQAAFAALAASLEAAPGQDGRLVVLLSQVAVGGTLVDTEDRVQRGVGLLRALVALQSQAAGG